MRTAPQLEDCQLVSCHDGAQTDRFKPACSGTNIDNVKPYMTNGDRWSFDRWYLAWFVSSTRTAGLWSYHIGWRGRELGVRPFWQQAAQVRTG